MSGDPANVRVTGARSLMFIRAGKNASALYRIFMKHRGYTAVQFLRRVRMRHARAFFCTGGMMQ
jgi:AraC-like DNA-binding protein